MQRYTFVAFCAAMFVAVAGCGDSATEPSDEPGGAALVTIGVGSETFRILLEDNAQIEAARAAQSGGRASIPNGRIVAGAGPNTGYTWHLEDVEFVEVSIELCDGRPSDVERQGTAFGGGRFCPWTARVLSIADAN
jgi:hypothetical protein